MAATRTMWDLDQWALMDTETQKPGSREHLRRMALHEANGQREDSLHDLERLGLIDRDTIPGKRPAPRATDQSKASHGAWEKFYKSGRLAT